MLILIFVHYISALTLSLRALYLFQIKEYRFDRFSSMLREQGVITSLYTLRLSFPKKSLRNILILLFSGITLSVLFLYSFEQSMLFSLLSFGFFLAPFTSLGIVFLGVILTTIPSYFIRKAIRYKAIQKVRSSNALFIGVTGTYGKTSTKEYLAHILSGKYNVTKTPKNMNTDVGIAQSIVRFLNSYTEVFIVELGSYRRGELSYASSYIPFSRMILTGLGNQHLDLYGSREALIEEETSPLYSLGKEKTVYVPDTSLNAGAIDVERLHPVSFGVSNDVDIRLINAKSSQYGSEGIVQYKNRTVRLKTSLLGVHSLENLLPAIGVACDLGMDVKTIESRITSLKPIKGKLSLHEGPHQSRVLHDGVNSNLNGFLAAISVLQSFPQKKKFIMTQGIIELGVEKRSSYKEILNKLNNTGISLYTTDKMFSTIKTNVNILTFNDVSSMKRGLISHSDSDTIVLLEGIFSKEVLAVFGIK